MADRDDERTSIYPIQRKTTRNGEPVTVTEWRGWVELDEINPRTGKPKRKYLSAGSKPAIKKKQREALNARDEGSLKFSADITFERWHDHYLTVIAPVGRGARAGNRWNTGVNNKSIARNHVYPVIGSKKLGKLAVEQIEAVYTGMQAKGLSDSMIQQARWSIQSSLDEARRRGRIGRNVAADATIAKGRRKVRKVVEISTDDARRMLDETKGVLGAGRWMIALMLGLRVGEYLAINESDLDLEYGIYWPRMQIQRQYAEHGCGKPTGKRTTKARPTHGCGEQVGTRTTQVTHWHGCGEPIGVWDELSHTVAGSRATKRPWKKYPCLQRQARNCPDVTVTGGVEQPAWPCGKAKAAWCPDVKGLGKEVDAWPCGKAQPAKCPEGKGGGVHFVPVKTDGSAAPVPLPGPLVEMLREAIKQRQKARMLAGGWEGFRDQEGREVPLIFCQPNGRPIEPRRDREMWDELCARAGVPAFNPHEARHFVTSFAVALDIHPRVAMGLLRHSSIAVTMDVYARSPAKEVREAADAIAAALIASDGLNSDTGS